MASRQFSASCNFNHDAPDETLVIHRPAEGGLPFRQHDLPILIGSYWRPRYSLKGGGQASQAGSMRGNSHAALGGPRFVFRSPICCQLDLFVRAALCVVVKGCAEFDHGICCVPRSSTIAVPGAGIHLGLIRAFGPEPAFAADPMPESTASGPVTLVSTKPSCSSCQINRPATHSCYVLAWSENGPEWTSSDSHLWIRSYQG